MARTYQRMCLLVLLGCARMQALTIESQSLLDPNSNTELGLDAPQAESNFNAMEQKMNLACVPLTSSTSWVDSYNTIHIRVYKSINFWVTEECWDGANWSIGSFSQLGHQSSSISWQDENSDPYIRVYVSANSTIQEYCCDPGNCWYSGSFSFPGISSSATVWTTPQLGIRVYTEVSTNGAIQCIEQCWDNNGWYTGGYS